MSSNLPVPLPPCPGCGNSLVVDDDKSSRSCPRCGSAFTVELTEPVGDSVYRSARCIELVPLREHEPVSVAVIPRWLNTWQAFWNSPWRDALRMIGGSHSPSGPWLETALDVRIGGPMTSARPMLLLGMVMLWIAGPFLTHGSTSTWLPGVGLALVGAEYVLQWQPFERVIVRHGFLVWQRVRRRKIVSEQSIELARITGACSTGGSVAVELVDGSTWKIGEGLRVPPRQRRWLAQRIAQLLPPPGLSSDDDELLALTDGSDVESSDVSGQ